MSSFIAHRERGLRRAQNDDMSSKSHRVDEILQNMLNADIFPTRLRAKFNQT
jgi:hypothetical protein